MNKILTALEMWKILESWFGYHLHLGERDHIQVQLVGFKCVQMLQ